MWPNSLGLVKVQLVIFWMAVASPVSIAKECEMRLSVIFNFKVFAEQSQARLAFNRCPSMQIDAGAVEVECGGRWQRGVDGGFVSSRFSFHTGCVKAAESSGSGYRPSPGIHVRKCSTGNEIWFR
jgi:hypothetical protein